MTRELCVDGVVGLIVMLVVGEAVGEIVKQRPQRAVAVAAVVRLELGRLQIDRGEADVAAHEDLRLRARLLGCLAAPAEPQPAAVLESGKHADCQTPGGCGTPRQGDSV